MDISLKDAKDKLISDNATTLIDYMYKNKSDTHYSNPEIRSELAVNILLKTDYCCETVLNKVIEDLQTLISDQEYLDKFEKPMERREEICKKISLINSYIKLSDTISLNTLNGALSRK